MGRNTATRGCAVEMMTDICHDWSIDGTDVCNKRHEAELVGAPHLWRKTKLRQYVAVHDCQVFEELRPKGMEWRGWKLRIGGI